MSPTVTHFRNFLGPVGSSLCDVARVAESALTLEPGSVTCEPCLARLGRLRDANIGLPTAKKRGG